MVFHVVLIKPRNGLSAADRDRLLTSFERAIREIPTVRSVRVGRRVTHGTLYEQRMPDLADYLVTIDFDDVEGLAGYLRHPAHADLGAAFGELLESALVYDFEETSLDNLRGR
jgi:hypothetical protein